MFPKWQIGWGHINTLSDKTPWILHSKNQAWSGRGIASWSLTPCFCPKGDVPEGILFRFICSSPRCRYWPACQSHSRSSSVLVVLLSSQIPASHCRMSPLQSDSPWGFFLIRHVERVVLSTVAFYLFTPKTFSMQYDIHLFRSLVYNLDNVALLK